MIDRSLTFRPHVDKACLKTKKSVISLVRLMPNIGKPKARKRKLLGQMVQMILLYGAPIWKSAIKIRKYNNRLLAVQRKMALRVSCGYRTVSTEAALVVAKLNARWLR